MRNCYSRRSEEIDRGTGMDFYSNGSLLYLPYFEGIVFI